MSALLLVLLHSLAWSQSTPAPQPSKPPVDIDKMCSKARAQDEANKNNPQYSQSDISVQCAEIVASKKGARLEDRLGKMRIVSTTTCTVAAGLCVSGIGAKVGKVMAKVCGGMGTALGTVDTVAQGQLEKDLNKDTGAFSAMSLFGMGQNLAGIKGSVTDMGADFEKGSAKGASTEDKKASCGNIGKAAADEAKEMSTHFDTAKGLRDAESDARKGLAEQVAQGGSFSNERADGDKDKDGDPNANNDDKPEADEELPGFPEEYAAEFEEATGLSVDDVMNSDESPEELAESIANSLGMDPEAMKNAIASAGIALPSDTGAAVAAESDGGRSSSKISTSNETFRMPDLSGLFKKAEREPAAEKKQKGQDLSKLTPAELERDTKHNLFLRVSLRYEKEKPQLEKLMWASKLNAHHNPKPLDTLSKRYPASRL